MILGINIVVEAYVMTFNGESFHPLRRVWDLIDMWFAYCDYKTISTKLDVLAQKCRVNSNKVDGKGVAEKIKFLFLEDDTYMS
jgi:hypothetical protein